MTGSNYRFNNWKAIKWESFSRALEEKRNANCAHQWDLALEVALSDEKDMDVEGNLAGEQGSKVPELENFSDTEP